MTQPGRVSPSAALVLAARVLRTKAAAIEGLVARRHMISDEAIGNRTAAGVMTREPVTIAGDVLAAVALRVMQARRITSLPVVDAERRPRGVMHIHDLWPTERW